MAVLDDGILVLANETFAQCLGYSDFEDLEATNLLDHTVDLDKDELRIYLKQAARTDRSEKQLPALPVVFRKANGNILHAELFAYHSRFDGQDVIEIYILTAADRKLVRRIINLPWKLYLCFALLIAISVLPNALLPKLNINNSPTTFLPPDAPSRLFNDEVREVFPDDEVILLLFEGVALFSDGFLLAYDDLTQSLEEIDGVEDVISLTRQDHITGTEDGFEVSPLVDIELLDESHPRDRRASVTADRFARNSLVPPDGTSIALVIIPESLDNSILYLQLEEEILTQVREHRLDGYLSAMTGEISTDVAQVRMILSDNMVFIPATVVIGLILTWLLFRRLLAVIVTGVVTGAVVNFTIAFYVVFEQPFNSISGALPPLLSALTIAVLVHFYNALYYASKRGLTGRKRVDSALAEIRKPALYSTLTTSVGLASLGLSPIPPISMFGLASAAGVFLIYLIVIHILPPIFVQFDQQPWPNRRFGLQYMDKLVSAMLSLSLRRPVVVIVLVVISLGACLPMAARIHVETNLLDFFPKDHELRRSTEHVEDTLVGTLPLEVVLTSESGESLLDPDTLLDVRQLQQWVEQLDSVDKTLSVADFIEEMHWGFHAEDPAYRAIPEDAELISQYLFVYDGEDIFDFIDGDYQIARIAINANVHGTSEISDLMDSIRDRLRQMPGFEQRDISWEISGAGRLLADQEDLLIESQVVSLGGALGLIFLLMLVSWRSLRDTLICMIPNLSPIILIFIVMGFQGIALDLATAMIASVAVGIAIDDTIHVYHGFIHRVRQGISPVLALVRTYQQAGRAVMTTTLILCSQFLLLLGSSFVPMGHFGMLASVGLVAALVFDLLLLPAILILVFKRKEEATVMEAVA